MLILLSFVVIVVALRFPETPGGKLLKQILIDAPARLAAKVTFGRIIILIFVTLIAAGLFALAKTDGLIIAGQGAPEGLAWLATFDVTTWADTAAVVMLIGAAGRLRGGLRAMQGGAQMITRITRATISLIRRANGARGVRAKRRNRIGVQRPPTDDGGWAGAEPPLALA